MNFQYFIFLLSFIVIVAQNPCSYRDEPHFARNLRGCSWYFGCENREVVRENRCPNGLYFNYDKQSCDYRDRVFCDLDERWFNQTCPEEGRGILVIPNPITCLKYTICLDGIQNDRSCEPGKHFSYYDNKCVDPLLADCPLDAILCRPSQETGLPTFVRNPRNCGSYFICVGETAVATNCPNSYHFSPERGICIPRNESSCVSEIPEDTPRIPDRVFTDDCKNIDGPIPHPEACEFYFFCAENRSYLQLCGEGLVFDINTKKCEKAENAQCVLDITTTESTTITDGSGDGDLLSFDTIIYHRLDNDEFENFTPETEEFIIVKN